MPTRHQKQLTFGAVLAALVSGLSYRMYRKAQGEIYALENAFEVTPATLNQLPDRLNAQPKRRVLVKLRGKLIAPKPLEVSGSSTREAIVLKKTSRSYSNPRLYVDNYKISSFAEDVEVKLPQNDTYAAGPKLFISPNLLEALEPSEEGGRVQFEEQSRLSSFLSMLWIKLPWRLVDSFSIVPQGVTVFAALDAVADTNGQISLIESSSLYSRRILTRKHYVQVVDQYRDEAAVWKGFAISAAMISGILAGVTALAK